MTPPEDVIAIMQDLLTRVSNSVSPGTLLGSIVVIVAVWTLRRIVLNLVLDRVEDVRVRYQWRKYTTYVATLISIGLLIPLWLDTLPSFFTYVGLLTAALAIVLREPLSNLAGWAFILWRRPFDVGDRIEIGAHAGDVVDLRLFAFSLAEIRNWVDADQSTGRIIHVPNKLILTESMANYSQGLPYIWHEVPVLITFESDWRAAKRILQEIAEKHTGHLADSGRNQLRQISRKYMLIYNRLTPTVYTSVEASGVLLTIRCLTEPRRRRGLTQALWEDILEAFATHENIELAYPTRRLYFRDQTPGSLVEDGVRRDRGTAEEPD